VIPMELTPKVFDDVEFRERFRGYDPDEVDAFLEQVARGVQELDQKLKESIDRAEKAEARAREAGDADEALRRTLVLAQRTADAAVSEAETRAAALLAEAEGKAATVTSDSDRQAAVVRGEAEAYASRTREQADAHSSTKLSETEAIVADMMASAEREAREGAEDLRQRLRTEVSALEALREHLRTDAGRLEAHIAIQRQRVVATVEALQRLSSDPDALREAPVPEFKPVESPPTAEAMGGGAPPAPPAPPPPVHALDEADVEIQDVEIQDVELQEVDAPEVDTAEPTEPTEAAVEEAVVEDAVVEEAAAAEAVEAPSAESVEASSAESTEVDVLEIPVEDEVTGEFPAIVVAELEASGAEAAEQPALDWDDSGPPTMEVPAVEVLDDDDPYIAELRRAIVDPSPLGPRDDFEPDDAMADFYGRELEDSRWKGFRRRR
jgi:cell division initiation protein